MDVILLWLVKISNDNIQKVTIPCMPLSLVTDPRKIQYLCMSSAFSLAVAWLIKGSVNVLKIYLSYDMALKKIKSSCHLCKLKSIRGCLTIVDTKDIILL